MINLTKILLSGYYGFNNAGDEAILCSIIDGLKQTIPNVDLVVLSGNPEETRKLYNVRALSRVNYTRLMFELNKADLLISGGGSLLQDATGSLTIPYYLSIIKMAKLMKVPIMFFSQGVGPVNSKMLANMIKRTLTGVNSITVRDQQSADLLHEIGLPNVRLTADPVFFLQPVAKQRVKEILIEEHIPFNENGPWIGVSVRPWQGQEHYVKEIAKALDEIIKKYNAQIIFLPFEYSRDYEVVLQVSNLMNEYSHVYILQNQYRADELLGICQQLDVMIGMRLHSLIFAARQGVNIIGISYDPKIDAFLERLAKTAIGTTKDLEASKIVENLGKILNDVEGNKQQVIKKATQLQQEAWQAIQIATSLALGDCND